jgi:hypothetical protein
MASFSVKVDISQVVGLSDRLAGLATEELGAATVKAINDTTDSIYDLARTRMLASVNLTDAYIQRKMKVAPATTGKPEASITAFGQRGDMTGLSHYGAMQVTQAVLNPTRSKGDKKRGIPQGQKAAGISVEVTRGKRALVERGFTMPGIEDKDGNMVVFARNRANKIRSRTGPSVYQLFRAAAIVIEPEAEDQLRDSLVQMAEKALEKGLF